MKQQIPNPPKEKPSKLEAAELAAAELALIKAQVLLKVAEVAKILRCNPGDTYKYIDSGLLPSIYVGSTKVLMESLMDFLRKYQGYDLSDPDKIIQLEASKREMRAKELEVVQ